MLSRADALAVSVAVAVLCAAPATDLPLAAAAVPVIRTLAGGVPAGNRLSALGTALPGISGLALDPVERALYIADASAHVIYRVADNGAELVRVAGGLGAGYRGDGGAAASAWLNVPGQLALEPKSRDLYIADSQNHRIRVVTRQGSQITTVAGRGIRGIPDDGLPTLLPKKEDLLFAHFSGDAGSPTDAELNQPAGVAFDDDGNLFIADSGNGRIRALNLGARPLKFGNAVIAPGTIATVAGTGRFGFSGDGDDGRRAVFAYPKALAIDRAGDVFVVDSFNHRVRQIERRTGRVRTLAATVRRRSGPVTAGWTLPSIAGLAVAPDGSVLFSDLNGHSIHRVSTDVPSLVAGVGVPGRSPDGPAPLHVPVGGPGAITTGVDGELFIAETLWGAVRRLRADRIETIVGGEPGLLGARTDPALPEALALAEDGSLIVADAALRALLRVQPDGSVERIRSVHDGSLRASSLAFAGNGRLIVADASRNIVWEAHFDTPTRVRMERVAGTGRFGTSADDERALDSRLSGPGGLAFHPVTRALYVSMIEMPGVRRIDGAGRIRTAAGTGQEGGSVPGPVPARQASFRWPAGLAFDRAGNLFIADSLNHCIRRLSPDGMLSTFAGTGERGYGGDGAAASAARFHSPSAVTVDAAGNLYVADTNNHRIRRIDATPPYLVRPIAGNGQRGCSGDDGPATAAALNTPRGIAVGRDGRIYISDSLNGRIRTLTIPADGHPVPHATWR